MNGANPLVLAVLLGMAALLPAVLLVATSFVKISVVLGVVRNALGGGDIPGATVVTALAVILSLHAMAPTFGAVDAAAGPQLAAALGRDPTTPEGLAVWRDAWRAARAPVTRFFRVNATPRDRAFFFDLARTARARAAQGPDAIVAPAPEPDDLAVLLPAFVTSELTRAFALGLLVLLPFLVVDLVVANVLAAMGITGLPHGSAALPFKLLLFVLADGWPSLCRALVLGYR
jgi:type III secretion protein R